MTSGLTGLRRAATAVNPAAEPWGAHDTRVLLATAVGIAIVILLIVLLKLHAFLALTLGALVVGLGSGIPLQKVIGSYEAGVGITAGLGLLIAIPCAVVAGPLFGIVAARWVPVGASGAALAVASVHLEASSEPRAELTSRAQDPEATRAPSFAVTLGTILLPVSLMLVKAIAGITLPATAALRLTLDFIGDPVFALLAAVLLGMLTFGSNVGFSAAALSRKVGASLSPIVGVLFIVGAGGGLKQVLVDGGTGNAIAKLAVTAGLSALLLGWIVAALIRLATGSATVATVTAAGIVAPLAASLTQSHLSLLVLAIGAGSLIFSHVNDAGFWLVKEYFGLSVGQTLKTWSVMETIISVMGLGLTLLLALVM